MTTGVAQSSARTVIAAQDEQTPLAIRLISPLQVLEDPLHDIVHLLLFRLHERVRIAESVADVIETEVMKNERIPLDRRLMRKQVVEVSRDVLIDDGMILRSHERCQGKASERTETKNDVTPSAKANQSRGNSRSQVSSPRNIVLRSG